MGFPERSVRLPRSRAWYEPSRRLRQRPEIPARRISEVVRRSAAGRRITLTIRIAHSQGPVLSGASTASLSRCARTPSKPTQHALRPANIRCWRPIAMSPGCAFGDLLQHGARSNRLYSSSDVSVSRFLVHRVSLIHCVTPGWCPETVLREGFRAARSC